MNKTAIMLRVSTDELAEIDRLAASSGASRAGWCMAQVRRALPTDAPRETIHKPAEIATERAAHNPLSVLDGIVQPPKQETIQTLRTATERMACKHPISRRLGNFCPVCGKEGIT